MKNLINYYYNLIIDEYRKIDDYYNFDVDNKKYCFLPFEGDINYLYDIYLILHRNNKYCHEIIINKDNSILTFYENKSYILLKKNLCSHSQINLSDIINYDILVQRKTLLNWKELWKEKIDYYEYQMNQIGFKYKILKNSFSYYIGMSETAINLLNYVNTNSINFYISHKRINYEESIDDFLNPLNIIIDNITRDIAEYFKINFINDNITVEQIIYFLNSVNFSNDEYIMLLSRLLYPSYYFDIYDKIIQGRISEEKVNFYIEKNVQYETFIKKIYKYLKNMKKIPIIEWLEN